MGKYKKSLISQKGQALITLVVFIAVGVVITSAAITVTLINSRAASRFSLGEEVLQIAQSGAENAILRLIRDNNYTGETLTVGDGQALITVSPGAPKTIVSEGVEALFHRKIQVVGDLVNNKFTITSWSEID